MKVKLIHPDATAPTRATIWSAGWDLYAVEDAIIIPGMSETIPLGVAVDIGRDNVGLLSNRSSQWFKLDVCGEGKIDGDYRGEVKIHLFNHGVDGYHIKKGDRVAQLIIVPCILRSVEVVDQLEETTRGAGGFGHSGV